MKTRIRQLRESFEADLQAAGQLPAERALEFEPDIVLMDINMPGMDGLEALKTIRDALPLTQVVMLTVQDDPGYLREALQLGARDYLIKPPTIDELLETIQTTHEIGRAVRVVDVSRPMQHVEELACLRNRAEQRIIATRAPSTSIEADRGTFRMTLGRLHQTVEIKCDARESLHL